VTRRKRRSAPASSPESRATAAPREQAASCQKVLGGWANICFEYATKRYRSNCINWGLVPFTLDPGEPFDYTDGDWVYVPGLRQKLLDGADKFDAKVVTKDGVKDIALYCKGLSDDEKLILTECCLMNYYAAGYGK
jgi:aconitate hydratase